MQEALKMKEFWRKSYGRKNINKLDWFLAVICCIIALGSLWISVGICVSNAAAYAVPAFRDVVHGFAFLWKTNEMVIANSLIFYSSLLFLIFGIIYLSKKEKKDRIPGVVAIFVACVGIILLTSLFFEFVAGSSTYKIHGVWSYGLIFFILCLIGAAGLTGQLTFGNSDVSLAGSKAQEEEVVEKPEPMIFENVPEEPKEAPKPAEEPEMAEDADGSFKNLSGRRRRIPFESGLKHCSKETREYYKSLVGALHNYKISGRMSIPGETYSFKRERLVFITLAGKTLKVYFALDPKEFEGSTIPVKDSSDVKKYEQTPAYLKIKSGLAARRAISLAVRVLSEHKVPKK